MGLAFIGMALSAVLVISVMTLLFYRPLSATYLGTGMYKNVRSAWKIRMVTLAPLVVFCAHWAMGLEEYYSAGETIQRMSYLLFLCINAAVFFIWLIATAAKRSNGEIKQEPATNADAQSGKDM